VSLPEGEGLFEDASPSFAISSDGRRVVFVGRAANETTTKLFVRDLTSFDTRLLVGTEHAHQPVFSPDGESLAYLDSFFSSIHKISTNGGAVTKLCETAAPPRGLAWTERGEILFGTFGAGIWRVSENGGTPEPLTTLAPGETGHTDPNLVSGNRGLLFTIVRLGGGREVAYLPPNGTEHRVLFEGRVAAYVPSRHLVFGRSGSAGLLERRRSSW
jgi:Tol biopolymer transport system component